MTAKQNYVNCTDIDMPQEQGELGLTQNWASVVAPFWKSVTQKSLHAFNIIVSPPAPLSLPQSLIDSCKLLIKMSMHIASFILSVCKYKETNITPPQKKPHPLNWSANILRTGKLISRMRKQFKTKMAMY